MLWTIDGYLAISHELLYVLAYKLIGRRCSYRLGDHFVHSRAEKSLPEQLLVLLFPLFVVGGIRVTLLVAWGTTYLLNRFPSLPPDYLPAVPLWHKALLVSATALLVYSGASISDLQITARLLLDKLG